MNLHSNTKSTIDQITEVVQTLSAEQQKMLLLQLNKNKILLKAKQLDRENKSKNLKISIKEICEMVNDVRAEKYANR